MTKTIPFEFYYSLFDATHFSDLSDFDFFCSSWIEKCLTSKFMKNIGKIWVLTRKGEELSPDLIDFLTNSHGKPIRSGFSNRPLRGTPFQETKETEVEGPSLSEQIRKMFDEVEANDNLPKPEINSTETPLEPMFLFVEIEGDEKWFDAFLKKAFRNTDYVEMKKIWKDLNIKPTTLSWSDLWSYLNKNPYLYFQFGNRYWACELWAAQLKLDLRFYEELFKTEKDAKNKTYYRKTLNEEIRRITNRKMSKHISSQKDYRIW